MANTRRRTLHSFSLRITGKRDQSVEGTVVAVKPRKPARQPATLQKVPELLLDDARESLPLAQTCGLCAKGLEVIAHNLVEQTLRRMPRFVGRRGRAHARPEGGRRASDELEEIGRNARASKRDIADFAVPCITRDCRSCPHTVRQARSGTWSVGEVDRGSTSSLDWRHCSCRFGFRHSPHSSILLGAIWGFARPFECIEWF